MGQDKNKASSNKSLTTILQSGQSQNNSDTLTQDVQDVLAEQMVKSKEKILNPREKKLKELEKKLHIKEISLSVQVQQNDFSKAYIVTMENKVKELESSNRLMKMKLQSQADASIDLPTPRDTSPNNSVTNKITSLMGICASGLQTLLPPYPYLQPISSIPI